MDSRTDFLLTILAAVAEEESHSISENMLWTYRENFKKGIHRLGNNCLLGYDMNKEGKLVPNEDAWIVCHIFNGYSEGKSLQQLAKELGELGAKTLRTKRPFKGDRIYKMLQNERYVGDTVLQKNPPTNYLTKRPQVGVTYKSYYIKNSHQGIVSREVWDLVQSRIAAHQKRLDEKIYSCGDHIHFLYGILFCGRCGAPYKRRTLSTRTGKHYKAWNCREREKGKEGNGCKNTTVQEKVILQEIANALGVKSCTKDICNESVEKVIILDGDVQVVIKRLD